MKKKFLPLAFLTLLLSHILQAQTWDGSAGTDWNTPANWSTNAVPVAAGNVVIPNTVNKPVLASSVIIANLQITAGGALDVNGFSVTVTGNINIAGATISNSNASSDIVINITSGGGAGSNYLGGTSFTDNVSLNFAGTAITYEGYLAGNIYSGNATFNLNGAGRLYSSYNLKSTFNANLTVNRTVAGITDLFNAGFVYITGNFSYTNTVGGDNYINSGSNPSGAIGGTVNINVSGTGNPQFYLRYIQNLTPGGSISVQNSGLVNMLNDTLLVNSMNITGFTTASSDQMSNCKITGNVVFAEGPGNTGSVYVGGNEIIGNTVLEANAVTIWYEGYLLGNVYTGNTSFNLNGTGTFNSSYNQKCSFGGNLIVSRTGIGVTDLFNAGFNFMSGNFSYTNNTGGNNFINSGANTCGAISGTINIAVSGTANPQFYLRNIKNLTGGGSISVQNSGYVFMANDTLSATVNISGFTGSSGDQFTENIVTGNVTINEAASNTGSVYIGANTINGNAVFTSNASSIWYESYQGSDRINGNLSFTRTAATGTTNLAYNDTTYVAGYFILNSTAGFDINTSIEFNGSSNSIFEQAGTQPIILPRLIINKTGNATLTLNDSVTVTTTASFINGNIYTGTGRELIFPSSVSYTGASASSHVIGPVIKVGAQAFVFPVGGPVSLNSVGMSAPVGAASRFRAAYIQQNPGSDGYNTSLKAGSFGAAAISQAGYWDVQRLTGVTNVTLTFGFGANPYEQYTNLASLKVAHWNGSQWDDHGNGGTTGTATSGTVVNSTPITSFSPFALAGVTSTYFYVYDTPGAGPDGTPVKIKGTGGYPPYNTKQLPAGTYTSDSVYLVPNGTSASFKLRDLYSVEKNDTTVAVAAAPTTYISANGNGTVNFTGWRHFVYLKNGSNQIIGAIKDNDLTLGNTTMTAYFSTANVATAPNGNIYLKRSFKITSQFAPAGTKRVRFYILKTEFNNLVAADPTSFPNGINSLTITKYTGPQEDSLFNPIPGGNSIIIPNSDISIVDMGTIYSLDVDVSGFSGFYIGGNQANVSLCAGSTISIPSDISGATYQWQVNTGSGFNNISNGGVYSGATTKSLTLTNVPTSYYGYQYRAFVNGSTYSQVYTAKFIATWQGTASNVWENTANWNCGILPDANTDVLINAGKPNYPQVGSNTSVRTMRVATGTTVTVKTGFNLTISK